MRAPDEMRPVRITRHYTEMTPGSVLMEMGRTRVLCTASFDSDVPRWMRDAGKGWLTAEYAMLPRSTHERRTEGLCPGGRVQEISRLIGRSLRMALDLQQLGERQLTVDCTVLQADGGTRTAAITGGWVAVALSLQPLIAGGIVPGAVLRRQIAAVSVGLVEGQPTLDLDYSADSRADVDLNVVMTAAGDLVELQGTGERAPFSRAALAELLDLAEKGIDHLVSLQRAALETAGAGKAS